MMMDAGNIHILTNPAKKLTTQKHGRRQKLFKANWREMSSRKKEKRRETSLCAPLCLEKQNQFMHVQMMNHVGNHVFSKHCYVIAMLHKSNRSHYVGKIEYLTT